MILEFGLAIAENLVRFACGVAFISGIGFFWLLFVYFIKRDLEGADEARPYLKPVKPLAITCIVAAFVGCFPSVDDLWRVRIGLIKLHLASPQNIEKGAEEIGRIAKKLECKYIGCEEKK